MARVTEIIDICRTVWRREPLVHEGRNYQILLPEAAARAWASRSR
jgi:hypothetical protein